MRRRDVLRGVGAAGTVGLAGCLSLDAPAGPKATSDTADDNPSSAPPQTPCESEPVCLDIRHDRAADALDTVTITHVGGRDLPANRVLVSGIAFEYPPTRLAGFTYSWQQLRSDGATGGIAGQSLTVHPALVHTVRVLWRHDGGITLLDQVRVSDCDSAVACFEAIHEGADDALDRLTVRHVSGRDLPAEDVFLTGIATDYPPEPETGASVAWADLSPLDRSAGIAGRAVRVTLGFVDSVQVLWRRNGTDSVIETFRLYGETSEVSRPR